MTSAQPKKPANMAERFVLKGALFFTLWYDMPLRTTRDADLLGFGASDLRTITDTFREIADIPVDDGLAFDSASVTAEEIRKEASYAGARVIIAGELARARCKVQIDVGFGDAITPAPVNSVFPVLLSDLPAPRLRTYPKYTAMAEKLHALVTLGMANSRLKDYFDLAVLVEREDLDNELLANAVNATFERRGTPLPKALPEGLSDKLASDPTRQALWQSFVKKNEIPLQPLGEVVERLRDALASVVVRA